MKPQWPGASYANPSRRVARRSNSNCGDRGRHAITLGKPVQGRLFIERDEMAEKAWEFWQLQNERRLDEAFDLLHPEGGYASICMPTWEPIPNSSGWLRKFLGVILEASTLRYERGDAIVEGNTVVQQFTGSFSLPGDDHLHDQRYCMIMTFRDSRIYMVKEFLDTKKEEPLIEFVMRVLEEREGKEAIAVNRDLIGTADAQIA